MEPYKIFRPNPIKLIESGYVSAKNLPVIFVGGIKYHNDANEFLYERCLGYWPLTPAGQELPLSKLTALTYAHEIANLCQYLDARRIDLTNVEYVTHLIDGYQKEMLSGAWSALGIPLNGSTINSRVNRACEFLQWLTEKGRRQTFPVPTRQVSFQTHSALDSHGHRAKTVNSRVGQVPVRPRALVMPTDESLGLWLGGVRRTFGGTVSLAVETVLQTALRKAELVGLRIDSIPRDPRDWTVVNPLASPESQSILMTVRYGTKGRDYGTDNGDKIGPEREILVPLELAKQINLYVAQDRPRALQKLLANYKGAELRAKLNDPHLFLDERTGERLTYDRFTHCWRSAPNVPCPAWCPHRGRHWWACMTLWRGIKEREAEITAFGSSAGQHLILLGTQILQLEIQDQLGHLSPATTRRYILWVARQLSVALPKKYAAHMDEQTNNEAASETLMC